MAIRFTEEEYRVFLQRTGKNPNALVMANKVVSKQKDASNKYRNVKVYIFDDDFVSINKEDSVKHGPIITTFDSKKEYTRWEHLKLLERSGVISKLETQTKLCILPSFVTKTGERIREISYKADFSYLEQGEMVIEDVKGIDKKTGKPVTTKDFKLKWKLLQSRYPDYSFRII